MAAEPLLELLQPYLQAQSDNGSATAERTKFDIDYLDRLLSLQLGALTNSEPQSLAQSAHTNTRALQALSSKSSTALVASANELRNLSTSIPQLSTDTAKLRAGIDTLDNGAIKFAEKYSRSGENELLERRKRALLMLRNIDRVSEVLELPALLSSAIHVSSTQAAAVGSNYTSALDLHSHIKRLRQTYPDSQLIESVSLQAESSMQEMKANLVKSLRGQNVKLAAGLRTIGWLRRIAPELGDNGKTGVNAKEGSYAALFLVCRLANLLDQIEALEALRVLADAETAKRLASGGAGANATGWSGGQQTERYLKRYIEIFREQSFSIVSMFRSIFPATEPGSAEELGIQLRSLGLKSPLPPQVTVAENDPLYPLPSALTTFPLHLVDLLSETLRKYLPNVQDKPSRESLLTQVLYCAGSLARLGADFSMILADLEADDATIMTDWVAVMKKHRVLAGRLQSMAGSQGKESSKLGVNGNVSKTGSLLKP